jgi:hypothetical protein
MPIIVRGGTVVEVVAATEVVVAGVVVEDVPDVPVSGAHPPTMRARTSSGAERRITAPSW